MMIPQGNPQPERRHRRQQERRETGRGVAVK